MTKTVPSLRGKRVLVVEDEYLLADDMAREFEEDGADVVGPAASVETALTILNHAGKIDVAVLDINLRGIMVFPLAELLAGRGVPFVFATGYDSGVVPSHLGHVPCCQKPIAPGALAGVLRRMSEALETRF